MNYFKNAKSYLIAVILALSITFIVLGDNLITLIKYNEYGGWGIGLFTLLFLTVCLISFVVALLIGFVIYFIIRKTKKKVSQ